MCTHASLQCFTLCCSEDDYDVFGLWRKNTVAGKLSYSSSKELPKCKQAARQGSGMRLPKDSSVFDGQFHLLLCQNL